MRFKRLLRLNLFKTFYYSLKFKGKFLVGRNVSISLSRNSKVTFDKGAYLELGIDYHIGRKTVLELSNNSNFYLKGKVKIMNGCLVSLYENATVTIGNNTFLNENSKIISEDNIFIGNDCAISWSVTIMDTDLHDIYINNVKKERKKTIFIGNNVLIGANASILKGAQVQSFSIVSFGTIVRSNSDLYNTIHFNDKSISFRELKWK